MKITVELPENDVRDICRVTGIDKKGPAIRKLVDHALMLERRKDLSQRFLTGEWGVELDGFEAARTSSREEARTLAEAWRS